MEAEGGVNEPLIDTLIDLTKLREPVAGWTPLGKPAPADRVWRFQSFDPLTEKDRRHPREKRRFRDVQLPDGLEGWTEAGYDEVECPTPALLSVTAGVVEPRYPSFKGIMAAKSKPVETVSTGDLGVEVSSWSQSIVDVADAPAREAGEVIVDEGEAHLNIVAFLEGLKVI